MLIQHILTEEIFSKVFDDRRLPPPQQRRQGALRAGGDVLHRRPEEADPARPRHLLRGHQSAAAQISSHHEKQTFLKVIYENFYKVYNTKAADRLGVVYTPNEIVRFMIEGADWLCEKHFGKQPDRQGCGNPRPGRRHRHLHLRAAGALPRPARKAAAQVPGRAARQRGGDPAVLRRQPEHRGHLRRDHRRLRANFPTCASSTRWTTSACTPQRTAPRPTCSAA